MTRARQQLGKTGEDLAARELTARGYAILARRYRTRHGEIDIVCDDHGTIVFVEVRAKSTRASSAAESITRRKMRKVTLALSTISAASAVEPPMPLRCRPIDAARGKPIVTVYANAFDAV
jgi:putative endonuclease